MAGSTENISQMVAATANRLRMVQVDFADQTSEVRREYLSEEIERALSSVVPDKRPGFLQALLEQFPSWDAKVEVQLRKDDTTDRSLTDARELQDPNFLVARLIDRAAALGEGERKVLAERLKEARLASASQGAWPEEAAAALRQNLRLTEPTIDPVRTLELVGVLSDFAMKLDQLVWSTWRVISPRAEIRQGKKLQQTIRSFITGSQDVPLGQVSGDLERLRQLIAAMISAIGQAGRQFASRHLSRFAPAEIEALASLEGGGFLVSKDVKCWKKYKELAESLNEAAIENEITETIANYAEMIIKGIGR